MKKTEKNIQKKSPGRKNIEKKGHHKKFNWKRSNQINNNLKNNNWINSDPKMNDCGSFTIEAAVIISFLVIVINIILVLTFFLYNRCSLERAAAMGALRGSQAVWEDNSYRSRKADEGVDEILSYNLLGTDGVEKKITVKGNRISVALDMHIRKWNFHTEVEKKSINPVLFIRNCRKLESLGKEQQ